MQRLPAESSHAERVRHAIGELLATGDAHLGVVAQRPATSV